MQLTFFDQQIQSFFAASFARNNLMIQLGVKGWTQHQ